MTPNANNKTIIMYMLYIVKQMTILIYPFCQAQVALLISEKTGILVEYFDFSNIFSSDFTEKLPEYNKIHNYYIYLLLNK